MIVHLLIALFSIAGAQSTFFLIHHQRMSAVRASSLSTLVVTCLTLPLSYTFIPSLQVAFFGATFVGMTSNSRMGRKRVLLASLLFTVIYIFVIPSLQGLGGGLGTAAFVSSATVYFVTKIFRMLIQQKKKSSLQ